MITFLATDCELTPARRQLPGLGPTKAGLVRALRNSGLFSRHPRRDEVRTFIQNAASPTRSGVACYRSASLGGPHHIGAMCRLPPRIERGATLGRGPRWGAAVLTTTGLGTGHKINPRARYVAGVESAKSVPGFKTAANASPPDGNQKDACALMQTNAATLLLLTVNTVSSVSSVDKHSTI